MSNITERARKGLPLDDVMIIDCHCHMGFWYNFHTPRNDAEGLLISMNTLGIDMACVTAHASIGPNYRFGNDIVIDAVSKYSNRFIGYVTVNPNYVDYIRNELDRCFNIPEFKGIKIHPAFHGCPVDYKNYRIAYETANEKGCIILIHTWGKGDITAVGRLADQYPAAMFIMGHTGGTEGRAMEDAIEVIKRCDNVYADLAVSLAYEGNVEWFVREIGSKKVLFGSDMPFYDPRSGFGRVAMADISDEEKKDIFGLNMKKLLKK